MTVSSETMLTITTETEILNTVDIRLIEKDMPTSKFTFIFVLLISCLFHFQLFINVRRMFN